MILSDKTIMKMLEENYRGKYQGQRGATGSRVYMDYEMKIGQNKK